MRQYLKSQLLRILTLLLSFCLQIRTILKMKYVALLKKAIQGMSTKTTFFLKINVLTIEKTNCHVEPVSVLSHKKKVVPFQVR